VKMAAVATSLRGVGRGAAGGRGRERRHEGRAGEAALGAGRSGSAMAKM
jgi:hypothetical protein